MQSILNKLWAEPTKKNTKVIATLHIHKINDQSCSDKPKTVALKTIIINARDQLAVLVRTTSYVLVAFTAYFSVSSPASRCSSRDLRALIIEAQVGGGCTWFSHTCSISWRLSCGSWCFASILASLPVGISRKTPNRFHRDATLYWRVSSKSFNLGVAECTIDPEATPTSTVIITS